MGMKNQVDNFTITTALDDPEWDAFVVATEGGHHVQTSLWAQVKAPLGWKPIRIIVKDQNGITAGCQILVHHYKVLGNIGYVTKGPLCRTEDPKIIKQIVDQLLVLCKKHNIRMLAVQPPNNSEYISHILPGHNFCPSTLELAPAATIVVDVSIDESQLFRQLRKGRRTDINQSKRAGVIIRTGDKEDLHAFYNLHVSTSNRQNFSTYSEGYFEAMHRVLEPHGYIQFLFAEYQGEPVSATLLVPFRDTVIFKMLGWSGKYGEAKTNAALVWGMLLWAKNHGYHYVDLEGVNLEGARKFINGKSLPESIRNSPDFFKYGFGGKVLLLPEAYEYVGNPLLRWGYTRVRPKVGTQSVSSKLLDWIRKR